MGQVKGSLTDEDLVSDDGERVDVAFRRPFWRWTLHTQQFRGRPQLTYIKKYMIMT